MGTRYLTAVIVEGQLRIAQYGQWDGYPSAAGASIFSFLKTTLKNNKMEEFAEKAKNCKFISQEELNNKYASLGIDVSSEFISLEDAHKFAEHFPQLDRALGCEVLDYIQENGSCELIDSYNFIQDSLFCEWAYIIDLDKEVLEVYGGFGKHYVSSTRFPTMTCCTVFFKDIQAKSVNQLVSGIKTKGY